MGSAVVYIPHMTNLSEKVEWLAQGHAVLECSIYKYKFPNIVQKVSGMVPYQLILLPTYLTITGITCLFFTSLTDIM